LADLNGFSELSVALCRFNHFASLDQKPSESVSRLAPIRLQREDFPEEVFGLGRMIAFRLELGALEQGEEIGPVLLAGGGGAGLHFLQDAGSLGGDVFEGFIHAFLCENAGHFIEDPGGLACALNLGEGSGQFINAGDASGVGLFGRFAEALSFLPAIGLFRLGKGGQSSAVDGLKQLGADFLLRDVASIFANLLDLMMLHEAEQPDAATYECEKDKAGGEGEEDFVLP
jgi:hypothetical protein